MACSLFYRVFHSGLELLHSESAVRDSQEIRKEIADTLADRTPDFKKRLELVKRLDLLLGTTDQTAVPPPLDNKDHRDLWFKARFIEAAANLQLNRLDDCANQLDVLRSHIHPEEFPELWFRCRSLSAALLVLRGERVASLKAYEALLADSLEGIPEFLVERARINYAVALNENGRTLAAAELYESIMLKALESKNDQSALHAGNNLISLLVDQGDSLTARQAFAELQPVISRNPEKIVTASLRLRELELLRLEGKLEQALSGLGEFIQRKNLTPLFLGSAHGLLADTYRDQGELELALQHAQQSVELLRNIANEATDAQLTLARVLMKKQDYPGASEALRTIDLSKEAMLARRRQVHQLQLEANLRQSGREEDVATLLAFLKANETKENIRAESISEYFETKLSAMHRNLAAQQEESLARIAAEKSLSERQSRRLQIGILCVGGVFCSLLLVADYRRRKVRRRLEEQRTQNEKLEAIVEQKTRELTANLQAQSDLAQALERKKRFETIGLLAGNVAHDINNLLQVIANANETLANPESSDSERHKVLQVSNDSLQHGSGIIRQLLTYSRQQDLAASYVCIDQYLEDCRPLFHSALGDRIELRIDNQGKRAFLHIDPSQLTTSILNILNNSSDAMPDGGKVHLMVDPYRLVEKDSSSWTDLPAGNYLRFTISDDGCGMNREQAARAFEPFYSTKSKEGRTGLGLSTVYGFVRQSGGDIRIQDKATQGTAIEILLPTANPPASRQAPNPKLAAESLSKKRLLLVEDHEAVANSLMLLISHLQLNAKWVASGDEAKSLLEQDSKFDFVLSDVHMPGSLDGTGLAKWVRSELPDIHIFLMSGYHDIPPEEILVPLLQKPFSIHELARFLVENSKLPRTPN